MNAEQSRRQDLNLRLSPYEGAALAKLSYTGIICFSATGRSRTYDAKLFRLPLYRLSYSGKLDFLLISGENCKEPNRGPEGNRTLHTRLAKPNRLLGSCEPINQILFSVQLLPIMCFRVAECIYKFSSPQAGVEPAIFILVEMIGLEPTNSTLSEWRVNQLHHISIFVKIYKILAILCFDVCKNR